MNKLMKNMINEVFIRKKELDRTRIIIMMVNDASVTSNTSNSYFSLQRHALLDTLSRVTLVGFGLKE